MNDARARITLHSVACSLLNCAADVAAARKAAIANLSVAEFEELRLIQARLLNFHEELVSRLQDGQFRNQSSQCRGKERKDEL